MLSVSKHKKYIKLNTAENIFKTISLRIPMRIYTVYISSICFKSSNISFQEMVKKKFCGFSKHQRCFFCRWPQSCTGKRLTLSTAVRRGWRYLHNTTSAPSQLWPRVNHDPLSLNNYSNTPQHCPSVEMCSTEVFLKKKISYACTSSLVERRRMNPHLPHGLLSDSRFLSCQFHSISLTLKLILALKKKKDWRATRGSGATGFVPLT